MRTAVDHTGPIFSVEQQCVLSLAAADCTCFAPTYACKIRTLGWISGKEINFSTCKTLLVVCAGYSGQHVKSLVAFSCNVNHPCLTLLQRRTLMNTALCHLYILYKLVEYAGAVSTL